MPQPRDKGEVCFLKLNPPPHPVIPAGVGVSAMWYILEVPGAFKGFIYQLCDLGQTL